MCKHKLHQRIDGESIVHRKTHFERLPKEAVKASSRTFRSSWQPSLGLSVELSAVIGFFLHAAQRTCKPYSCCHAQRLNYWLHATAFRIWKNLANLGGRCEIPVSLPKRSKIWPKSQVRRHAPGSFNAQLSNMFWQHHSNSSRSHPEENWQLIGLKWDMQVPPCSTMIFMETILVNCRNTPEWKQT